MERRFSESETESFLAFYLLKEKQLSQNSLKSGGLDTFLDMKLILGRSLCLNIKQTIIPDTYRKTNWQMTVLATYILIHLFYSF